MLGNLYFGLGDETNEYYTIKSFMIALSTLFLLFQMAFLGFVFAEIYFKCSNLNSFIDTSIFFCFKNQTASALFASVLLKNMAKDFHDSKNDFLESSM